MAKLKPIVDVFVDAAKKWTDDRATRLGAALAYYTLFSMAPLLILLSGFIGRFLGEFFSVDEISRQIELVIGADAAEWIMSIIDGASTPTSFTIATLISLAIMFWGASNIFNHLKETLNFMWGVKAKPGAGFGILVFVRGRLLAFAIVLIAGVLFAVYFLANTAISIAIPLINSYVPDAWEVVPVWRTIQAVQLAVAFLIVTLLFALFYKILPDVKIKWRDVWVGAAVTSLLFGIGTVALSIYLSFSSIGSLYGAAGSILVILMWVNYSAQIFLYGVEFTYIYTTRHGAQIVPASLAVSVREPNGEVVDEPDDMEKGPKAETANAPITR
ncbi:MAG TPA: YihY/virulence factor BrkB family protein [candidate division Zixibacteria bacterium]|nr:YihY/virulence factor BrkB family protein [candidate division Zixibacteria bacterium]